MRALVLALLLLAPLALADAPRVESRIYVGPTHDTSARVVACHAPAPIAVDGACFPLDGSESNVDVTVEDATGLPVQAHVFFRDASGLSLGGAFVCTSAVTSWAVPAGAATLNVWLIPNVVVDSPDDCPLLHGQATVGTVTASFR